MGKYVTINLFDVSHSSKTQSLSDTLDEFSRLPLDQRWRSDIRLERVDVGPSDSRLQHPAYHLDFAKRRDIGPGRMSQTTTLTDTGLNKGESFGEETAALFLPHKQWLLVLHNQYGVGPSRIAGYFNALDAGNMERHFDYEIKPRIDSERLRKMRAMKSFTHVNVTANIGAFEDADEVTSESVWDVASDMKAVRVSLRLMANEPHRKGKVLNIQAAKKFINSLLRNVEEVDKIEIKSGDESLEAADRVIDLIDQKVRYKYSENDLSVVNHRYTHVSKIALLRRASRRWLDAMD